MIATREDYLVVKEAVNIMQEDYNRVCNDNTNLRARIKELEQRLKEKETYHADCLRIKQLENQVEGYKGENGEQFERIEQLEQQLARYHKREESFKAIRGYSDYRTIGKWFCKIIEEFESEQNERKSV